MDPTFLTELRTLAALAADALESRASLARDADSYQAAEVADVAANAFRALATLAARHLAAERARLVKVMEEAWQHELDARAAFDTVSDMEQLSSAESTYADSPGAFIAARRALASFDAATGGGE